jgi:hypothetical protein
MKVIGIGGSLLLGTALMVGCNERNDQTGPTSPATGPISADVAAGNTSVVLDATGDWVDITGQDYQDEVRAEITKKGNTFVFVMTLAGAVQDNPPFPSWADMLLWDFALDTRPTAFPVGYPFTKKTAAPWEFVIGHFVYPSGFTDPHVPSPGVLLDRTPLLTGGEVKVTPIQFTIDGAKMTWVVDAALLGDLSTFQWAAGTSAWQTSGEDVKNGYNQGRHFDLVPDAGLAAWPK